MQDTQQHPARAGQRAPARTWACGRGRFERACLALAWPLLAVSLGACVGPPRIPPEAVGPAPTERSLHTLRERDPASGVLVREYRAWLEPGAPARKEGLDVARWPDGSPRFERSWHEGEPCGTWLAWYRDGTPSSRVVFAGADTLVEASFWHPDGTLSARGLAHDGVREGLWTHYHANGRPAAVGNYVRSLREGEWSFFSEAGELLRRVRYERGRRLPS